MPCCSGLLTSDRNSVAGHCLIVAVMVAGVLRGYGAHVPVHLWRAPTFEEIAARELIRNLEP